jgi:hypothetical protein
MCQHVCNARITGQTERRGHDFVTMHGPEGYGLIQKLVHGEETIE